MKRLQNFSIGLMVTLGFSLTAAAGIDPLAPLPDSPKSPSAAGFAPAKTSGAASTAPTTQATQATTQCERDRQTAVDACEKKESMAGMKAVEQMMFAQQMRELSKQLAQASSQSGSAAACYAAAAIGPLVAGLSGMKHDACKSSMKTCETSCQRQYSKAMTSQPQDQKLADEADKNMKSCKSEESNAQAMMMQIAAIAAGVGQATQCGDKSSTAQTSPPLTPAQLAQAPGCFDITCYCQQNSSDPICAGNVGTTPGSTGLAGAGGLATPGITTSGDDPMAIDTTPIKTTANDGHQATGGGAGPGGGLPGGGAGGAPLGAEGDGTAATGINKDVITGTSSGGAGVSGLSALGGGGGGAGAGSGGPASDSGGFNLSKYFPKSLFKNRGLAGMSVPATDGVTGPTGPSIWEKVHAQYESKKPTLIQDK